MINWLNQINQLFVTGTTFVLATISSIDGTSPETPGAQLIITADGQVGNLHSSHREKIIVEQSRQMLCNENDWLEKSYPLGSVAGTKNGSCTVIYNKFAAHSPPNWLKQLRVALREGRPVVLANHITRLDGDSTSTFEVFEQPFTDADCEVQSDRDCLTTGINKLLAPDNRQLTHLHVVNGESGTYLHLVREAELSIAVVGRSPVALALISQLLLLPVQILWICDRFLSEDPPDGFRLTKIDLVDTVFATLSARTKVAIATSDHALDIRCCHLALSNHRLTYIGCLGSIKKTQIVRAQMTMLGVSKSRLDNLTMPIGLDSIPGKQPAIIAASIVAQLLADPS